MLTRMMASVVGCVLASPLQLLAVGLGGGTFGGDGGPAIEAQLNNPRGVAVDQAGNLYIADSSNDRIRRVDRQTGIITTVVGSGERGYAGDGGPAWAAKLSFPHGLTVDENGTIYIADAGNHRIRKVDGHTRTISTLAGNGNTQFYGDGGAATAAGLSAPRGIALDKTGILYISDTNHGRIRQVGLTGRITTLVGSITRKGRISAYLQHPVGLAVGPDGQIYWTDATLNRVKKADPSRADPKTKSIWITIVAGSETMGFSGDGGPARQAELGEPAAVAFDSKGNLYIADHSNVRIRRLDAKTDVITTVAGNGQRGFSGDGGLATEASLNAPAGLAFDSEDNLYIADAGNHRIRMITMTTGIITTVAGSGPADEEVPQGRYRGVLLPGDAAVLARREAS